MAEFLFRDLFEKKLSAGFFIKEILHNSHGKSPDPKPSLISPDSKTALPF
jgi:hypothetical protein